MPKHLIITTGLHGILNASYELAARLATEGHDCTLSSPGDVGKFVQAQGFDFLQLDPVNYDPAPPIPVYRGVFRKPSRMLHKIMHAKKRREEAVKALGMKGFLSKISQLDPDQIWVDVELHEHIMTLHANNFNFKILSQWFSTWNRKGLPPIVTDIIPGKGFRGSPLGLRWAWAKIKVKRGYLFFKKKVLSWGTDRRSVLLAYADTVGFSRTFIKENYWPGPFSYDKLPMVSMTDEELEFPHDVRPNLEYIGRMVYEKRAETNVSEEVLEQVEQLLRLKATQGKKLIYCSVSTFKSGDFGFLSKVVEAVKGDPDWLLIIGLGGKLDEFLKEDLPENVRAFTYVPQMTVLKEADLSINHGGIHTINECLHFDVPMLVYSGKRSDQNGCAARIQYHGKGIMGDKDKDSVEKIKSDIEAMLSSNYQSNE